MVSAAPAANCRSGPSADRPRVHRSPLVLALLLLGGLSPLIPTAARAGVQFENCQSAADGSVTCDTRPSGNTLADDEAARYGLFDEASPGWAEFDPYEGYDDMFGGNWT